MKVLSPTGSATAATARRRTWAFTFPELMIAGSVVTFIVAAAMVVVSYAGRSLAGISKQSAYNQKAGYAEMFLISRVRAANYASNNVGGDLLTLGFDDNIGADSSGDGDKYNDHDHFETFLYTNKGSTKSNQLLYTANAANGNAAALINGSLRTIPSLQVFFVTNKLVSANFALVDTNDVNNPQTVDIRTSVARRN